MKEGRALVTGGAGFIRSQPCRALPDARLALGALAHFGPLYDRAL